MKPRLGLLVALFWGGTPGCNDGDEAQVGETDPAQVCGDSVVDTGEACDDGTTDDGATDDGTTDDGDGCSGDCPSEEICGNGVVDSAVGEACDDGNTDDGDGCSSDCLSDESCGNGVVDTVGGEACDDGNVVGGDGCASDCLSDETCGNGIVDAAVGEACDDGNVEDDDGCLATCALASCGDGIVDASELCDDGNVSDGDGCNGNCTSDESCGNGIVDTSVGESCDEGDSNSDTVADACRTSCTAAACGDSVQDTGEACDDGNAFSGDGCAVGCQSDESCGNGVLDSAAGEACDDGDANSDTLPGGCTTNCTIGFCGDGVIQLELGEACDGCTGCDDATCQAVDPTCGCIYSAYLQSPFSQEDVYACSTGQCELECTAPIEALIQECILENQELRPEEADEVCRTPEQEALDACANGSSPGVLACTTGNVSDCLLECPSVDPGGAIGFCGDGNIQPELGEVCDGCAGCEDGTCRATDATCGCLYSAHLQSPFSQEDVDACLVDECTAQCVEAGVDAV
ncbi:MAG: DUF4215 domain-containing protein, partial [Nannocystaceae bacterium]|nr:DUF4215 domain-containing protein [Nannocystaceae bacterium]